MMSLPIATPHVIAALAIVLAVWGAVKLTNWIVRKLDKRSQL